MIFKRIYVLVLFVVSISVFSFADSLSDVDINFCDSLSGGSVSGVYVSGSILSYKIGVEQEGNICYTVSNKSMENVFIKVSFVDGTFTNDQWQNKACLSDSEIEYFGKYVTGYESILALSGGQVLEKNAKFLYPMGSDGVYHGCLVYSVISSGVQGAGGGANFAVLMRRAKFVDIFVGNHTAADQNAIALLDFDVASGENLSSNPKIRIYMDPSDGKYVMQFNLKNISSSDQDVGVTGKIANFLGYKRIFSEPRRLRRGETLLVTKKIEDQPLYNLNIKLNISHTPYYTFGDEKLEPGYVTEKTNMWIFDTMFIITLVGLILILAILILLIVLIRKKGVGNNGRGRGDNGRLDPKITEDRKKPEKKLVKSKRMISKAKK